MRGSLVLYRSGFWTRSWNQLKKNVNLVVTKETIRGPRYPMVLHSFDTPESVRDDIKLLSDRTIGGSSQAHLDWIKPSSSNNFTAHARFHGCISQALPDDQPDVMRSGYAAFRTRDPQANLFGRGLWDVGQYAFLGLRVKSDGRSYLINVQAEGLDGRDLHQHRLFATRPGQWETVLVSWHELVRTAYGHVIEPQYNLNKQRIKSIGIGLTDRREGPFELCVSKFWATNAYDDLAVDTSDIPVDADGVPCGGLRNKKGETVRWTNERRQLLDHSCLEL